MKNKHAIRLPRPFGITQVMAEYHKDKSPDLLLKVQTFLIQNWLLSNGKICGRVLDCNSLSKFLLCSTSMIQEHMRNQVLGNRIWDKESQEAMIQALIGHQLQWAIEDRMEINHQVEVLRNVQGDKYMPFISAELNKALGLKLSSSNGLQSLVRGLSGGGSVNIFQQFNQQNNVTPEGVTVEEAITIIQEENSRVLDKSKELQYIEASYPVEDLPEVVANKQTGVDTSKEGLTLNRSELNIITDDYKGVLREFDQAHHEMRREIEYQIDTEAVDPELDNY